MADCSKTGCSNQASAHGNCARCGKPFCLDHKDHLLFLELNTGVAGYASETLSGLGEAKKEHDELLERAVKEWVEDAEDKGLNPRSWGDMQEHRAEWEHNSGVGWYFCEGCHDLLIGKLDSNKYNESPKKRTKLGQDKDKCFIATEVYGNIGHSDVKKLRNLRDKKIKKYELGKAFVRWYYRNGKTIANYIKKSNLAKRITRYTLSRFVYFFLK